MEYNPPRSRHDFSVAIICAIKEEADAVHRVIDHFWDLEDLPFKHLSDDDNTYTYGVIGPHNIVMAYMPDMGTLSASSVAKDIQRSFSGITLALLVGICGGVPVVKNQQIYLGDLVVSTAVVPYDLGKQYDATWDQKVGVENVPGRQSPKIRGLLAKLKTDRHRQEIQRSISACLAENGIGYPGQDQDNLFDASYLHKHQRRGDCEICGKGDRVCDKAKVTSCADLGCDHSRVVRHREIAVSDSNPCVEQPQIHLGPYGSASTVMKSGKWRDEKARKNGLFAFEMEGSGAWDCLPSIILKAVCDYADSHKNDDWHEYAAAVAAAAAKSLLEKLVPPQEPRRRGSSIEVTPSVAKQGMSDAERKFLQELSPTNSSGDKNSIGRLRGSRVPGTCEWILKNKVFQEWLDTTSQTNVLWLFGNPGIGKTVISVFLTDILQPNTPANTRKAAIAYFFCDFMFDTRNSATSILRSLLAQFGEQNPAILKLIKEKHDTSKSFLSDFDILWVTFKHVVLDQDTGPKICLIDALDECDEPSQIALMRQLRSDFNPKESSVQSSNVRILITSRDEQLIKDRLMAYPKIGLNDEVENIGHDIDVFIEGRLAELGSRWSKGTLERATTIIKENSQNSFIWIGWACHEVEAVRRSKDVVPTLQGMPKGTRLMYERIMIKALENDDEEGSLRKIVDAVVVARRPYTVEELSIACQIHLDDERDERLKFTEEDIGFFGSLFEIHDDEVRLLHQSVQDYIVDWKGGADAIRRVHSAMAMRCLDCLVSKFDSTRKGARSCIEDCFYEYAADNWQFHAREAGECWEISGSSTRFFAISSAPREYWLDQLKSRFKLLTSFRPTILELAAQFDLVRLLEYAFRNLAASQFLNNDLLLIAVDHDSFGALEYLLSCNERSLEVTEALAIEAARDARAIELLLDGRDDHRFVTEDVVKSAIEFRYSEAPVRTLIEKCRIPISISDDLVLQAARSWSTSTFEMLLSRCKDFAFTPTIADYAVQHGSLGLNVLELLHDRYRDEFVVESFHLEKVGANSSCKADMMAKLLEWYQGEVTNKTLCGTFSRSNIYPPRLDEKKFMLLSDRCREPIDEHTLFWIARSGGHSKEPAVRIFKSFLANIDLGSIPLDAVLDAASFDMSVAGEVLDRFGDRFPITQTVVERAAYYDGDVFELVLDRFPGEVSVTRTLVFSSIDEGPQLRSNVGALEVLLDRFRSQIFIDQELVMAAVKHQTLATELLTILFERSPNKIIISEEIMQIALRRSQPAIITLILEKRGNEIVMTEDLVKRAASSAWAWSLPPLIDYYKEDLPITNKAVALVCGAVDFEILRSVFRTYGQQIQVDEDMLLGSMRSFLPGAALKPVDFLLRQPHAEIGVTEKVMVKAARYPDYGHELVGLLLDKCGEAPITFRVAEAAASNQTCGWRILRLLKEKCSQRLPNAHSLFQAAAAKGCKVTLDLLFSWEPEYPIPYQELLEAAAGNDQGGEIMKMLRRQCESNNDRIEYSDRLLQNSAKGCSPATMRLLFDWFQEKVVIEEDLLVTILKAERERTRTGSTWPQDRNDMVELIFDRRGDRIKITTKVVEAAIAADKRWLISYLTRLLRRRYEKELLDLGYNISDVDISY